MRVKVSEQYQQTTREVDSEEVEINTPATSLELSYGWDALTIGLGFNYSDGEANNGTEVSEDFLSRKALAQLAYTFNNNWTVGLGQEMSWLDVTEQSNVDRSFEYKYDRTTVGLSYHTEKMEFGVAYASNVHDDDRLNGEDRVDTLSLAKSNVITDRDIYLPATTTVYGRGNPTNNFSVLTELSYASYDENVEGSVFDKLKVEDAMTAKISELFTGQIHVQNSSSS